MRVCLVLLIGALGALCGCHLLDVPETKVSSSCPNSAVINAGSGVLDFKERVARQITVAPPDSVLDVVLLFETTVTQADLDRIGTSGGTNVASAGGTAALKAQFTAQNLGSYVASDAGRLTDAVIYIAACMSVG